MAQLFTNNAASKLAAALTIGGTSLTLTTGEGAKFPAITGMDNFLVTLVGGTASSETSWEIVSVTARAGDVLTVVRAQEGTAAAAWAIATPVELRATAGTLASLITVAIRTPTNVTPAAAATNVNHTATLTGSTFNSLYGLTMTASQWQVSTVSTFASTVISTGDIAGTATAYAMVAGSLAVSTVYFWRVRYKNSDGVYSDWSTGTSFTTAAVFTSYIATPTATPAAFGDALEGGFYAGLVWNEVVQTASSFAIGTGSKAFTVADMSSVVIVYAGQTLEVRSRANPANKMIGVVTGALSTTLTINVTSVSGAGTFSDWSIMSQYRVIVAPKASGESASVAYKNTSDFSPAACGTLTEGRKATLAMVAAGSSTVYPAAYFCNNLNIASRTDWYLPARDELELCWRNLKPTADANYVSADRPTTATPNYANLGSNGDTANTHGLNNNSSPTGAAYIAGTPAQVAAGKNFRTGESEAFAYGTATYWSSSESSATEAWFQRWVSGGPGLQTLATKTFVFYVRAVRRSII